MPHEPPTGGEENAIHIDVSRIHAAIAMIFLWICPLARGQANSDSLPPLDASALLSLPDLDKAAFPITDTKFGEPAVVGKCGTRSCLGAQDYPREAARGPLIKAGMSLVYVDFESGSLSEPAQRTWQWDATMGLSPQFGIGFDLGFSHPDVGSASPHSTVLTYLAGPVWYPTTSSNLQTYVHGFAGPARVSTSGFGTAGVEADHTKLAWKVGAGVEIRLFGPINVRLGLDYMRSQDASSLGQIRGQNHLRQMIGLQYVFGTLRKRHR